MRELLLELGLLLLALVDQYSHEGDHNAYCKERPDVRHGRHFPLSSSQCFDFGKKGEILEDPTCRIIGKAVLLTLL